MATGAGCHAISLIRCGGENGLLPFIVFTSDAADLALKKKQKKIVENIKLCIIADISLLCV